MKVYWHKGWNCYRVEGEVIKWHRSFLGHWQALVRITKSEHKGYRIGEFVDMWAGEIRSVEA